MSPIVRIRPRAAWLRSRAASAVLCCALCATVHAQAGAPAPSTPEQMRQYANDLNSAIYSNDEAKIESIVTLHPELVTRMSPNDQSPLQSAVNVQNIAAVKFFLSKGANPSTSSWYGGDNPIEQSLNDSSQLEIFRMLFEKIGDVKALQPDGTTLIQQAVRHRNRPAIQFLLQRGATLSQVGVSGDTPLHEAVRNGDKDMVRFLVEYGAKVDARNYRGDLPIHLSMRSGYTFSNSGAFGSGYYAPSYVASKGNAEITLLLVDMHSPVSLRDQFGMTPFAYALLNFDRLEYGALANSPKDRILTVFDAAARNDASSLVRLLAANPLLATERLSNGATPIHVAALWGAQDAVALLLKHGADINTRDGGGSTPLHYASRSSTGAPMISYLLAHGAYIAARNARDETALHVAVLAHSIDNAKLLIARKADVHARGDQSGAPLADVDPNGGEAMAKLLLDAGADVREATANNNESLISSAVESDNAGLVALLAKHGADVNAFDRSGYTYLMRAVMRRSTSTVKMLLTLGANPDIATSNGDTALTFATRGDDKETAALLQKKPQP